MSLRGSPVEERAALPDGRTVVVRIGIAEDPYIDRREHETVSLELVVDDATAAALNTVLDPADVSEARALARDLVARLESGELEPTAGAVEPYAHRRP